MEKSRAIELLEHLAWDRDIDRNPYGDALNMAIEALKAQHSQEGTTSDTISRQAAIDVIEDYPHGVWNVESMEDMVDKIKALPSVQPEPPIIKCKDCKWWKKQKDSEQGRCGLLEFYPTGGWYCANGARERRTDDKTDKGSSC